MRRPSPSRSSRRREVERGRRSSPPNRRNTVVGERLSWKPPTKAGGFPPNALYYSSRPMIRRLLDKVVRRLELPAEQDARLRKLLDTEWLITNGLGGYASSTMAGAITRRYHGLLVAALPNPLGRMVMLNHLGEALTVDGQTTPLNGEERVTGKLDASVALRVADVRLEAGLPVWEYAWDNVRI